MGQILGIFLRVIGMDEVIEAEKVPSAFSEGKKSQILEKKIDQTSWNNPHVSHILHIRPKMTTAQRSGTLYSCVGQRKISNLPSSSRGLHLRAILTLSLLIFNLKTITQLVHSIENTYLF